MKFRKIPAPTEQSSYPHGFAEIHARIDSNRMPFVFLPDDLPDPNIDLKTLKNAIVPALETPPVDYAFKSDFTARMQGLQKGFEGQSQLCFLVSKIIVMSRRDGMLDDMRDLWHRIWDEEAEFLIENLDIRWKISAMRSFSAIGKTEAERRLGSEIFVLTGMMKLGDSERNFSGTASDTLFPAGQRIFAPTSLGLAPYAVNDGDLDLQIINQIYESVLACNASGAGKLGLDILTQIDASPATVFRRLMKLRQRLKRWAKKDTPKA